MASRRSLRLVALSLGIAVALGLLTLGASSPGVARALPADVPQASAPGTAFVALDGSDEAPCSQAFPCRTVQYAIDQAAAGDTIYVAAGVYTGTGAAVITVTKSITLYGGWDGNATGDPVRDPAVNPTVLDAERQRRVVYIKGPSAPTVDGFSIARGDATGLTQECGTSYAGCGGGILIWKADPTIAHNVITDNVAASTANPGATAYGGGIYAQGATGIQIRSNRIVSNTASLAGCGQGGGVYVWEYGDQRGLAVQANEILSNCATTTDASCAWGGGIAGGGSGAVIEGNLIEGNWANAAGSGYGAAIYSRYGSASYLGNLVRGNQGDHAIHLSNGRALLEANQIVGNATGIGVQLVNDYASGGPRLVNNVVARSGDYAIVATGHVSYPLSVNLLHNTLAGSGTGCGLYAEEYATLQMANNIVAGFSVGITCTASTSSTLAPDHTLFWGNGDDGIRGTNPVDGDPAFVDAAAGDYHLGGGSAARDAGVDAGITTDMDGEARPFGAGFDIGADETRWYLTFLPLALKN